METILIAATLAVGAIFLLLTLGIILGRLVYQLREAWYRRRRALLEPLVVREIVAAGRRGLLVYRLRGGSADTLLAEFSTEKPAAHVAAWGSVALVGHRGSTIQVVDLTDPASPRELSRVRIHRSAGAGRMRVEGDRAYVAADVAGMAVIDLEDPAAPRVLFPRGRRIKIDLSPSRDER